MPSTLFTAAVTAVSVHNPLIGTWIADTAAFGTHPVAAVAQPTMTITRDAISFGSGEREVGVAPIAAFDPQSGGTLSVRTRFGDVYRFRFTGADRLCSVDVVSAGRGVATRSECFSRSHDKV